MHLVVFLEKNDKGEDIHKNFETNPCSGFDEEVKHMKWHNDKKITL